MWGRSSSRWPLSDLDAAGFGDLFGRLAAAWAALDAEAAADCFTDDAIYMEPPDVQLFQGRDQLLAYFSPLTEGTYLRADGLWFDEESQAGAVEFTFGMAGAATADHGVVVIGLVDGKIASWREYHRKGPADFDEFISAEGKEWTWHIGNYP